MTRHGRFSLRPVTTLIALAVAACGVSTGQGKQMDERMRRIEVAESATASQLDQQRTVFLERISVVDRKIGEVQQKLDELKAMLEDQQRYQDELEAALAAMRSVMDARPQGPRPAAAAPKAASTAPRATQPRSEQAEFIAKAQEQDAAGNKVVASELYAEFVRRWPADPKSPEAWFRIGEIAYGETRYADAMTAYGHLAERFPRSDRAPESLLRTAESMTALGMKDDAKAIYQAVGARYPKSAAARKAEARLAELYPSSGAMQ